MVTAVKELSNARILLHSCGSVAPMIPDMIDTGIDALNPVQVSADNMDPAKLKADFGDRLAFWGGIDTQDILPFRTPAEVGEHVHYIIKTLGKGGGYVLSTVHNIQEQVPPENIVAMFEACLGNRPEDRFENTHRGRSFKGCSEDEIIWCQNLFYLDSPTKICCNPSTSRV